MDEAHDPGREKLRRGEKIFLFVVAAIVAFFALAGLSYHIDTTPGANGLSPRDTEDVNAGLRREVRDPSSLQSGGMIASGRGSSVWVCGWLNARNGFGGYAGPVPFHGLLDRERRTFDALIGDNSSGREIVLRLCDKDGISLGN